MNVVIIGGGIIGLAAAYYLRKAGLEVSVVDKNDISDGCSFGNIGYISPSHFIPLATPGIIKQGMKWMMSSSSPFYIKPRLNADLIRWGLTFRKSANKSLVEKNAPHLNNLLQLSREQMTDLKMIWKILICWKKAFLCFINLKLPVIMKGRWQHRQHNSVLKQSFVINSRYKTMKLKPKWMFQAAFYISTIAM
ncbi:FAD-dependent oxidoreductase [Niabella defluvii]|nr:FAD-dependent oxidoreductase [Niabella sp. I65]